MRHSFSSKDKRQYMKMFFEGASSEFCFEAIKKFRLGDWETSLLISRYAQHKSDKEIANTISDVPLSKDWINKEIAKSLEKAYDSLKTIEHEVWTKRPEEPRG